MTAAGIAAAGGLGQNLAVLGLGAAGLFVFALGLATRWSAPLAAGIALLGAEQAVRLAYGPDSVDPWTPVYAAALLLAAELAWWSIEQRVRSWTDDGLALRRLAAIVGLCAAGALLAALIVVVAGAPLRGGAGLELTGVAAAVAAVAVVAFLAHRPVREQE